jgi:hypothetical protein
MIAVRSFRRRASPFPPGTSTEGVPVVVPAHSVCADPIGRVLRSLRTRRITLLVDRRELSGKLVSLSPITLAGDEGQVIVVRLEAIQAVIF